MIENKKILVTGQNGFIGSAFVKFIHEQYPDWEIDTVSLRDDNWKNMDFSSYHSVLHAAGKAHADTGTVTLEEKKEYYAINTTLTKEVAKKAKTEGVRQFIYLSSIIIYGDSAPYGKEKQISASTPLHPSNCYGDSKKKADLYVQKLNQNDFRTAVIRLPMIYGQGSKGNYSLLSKAARRLPIFPKIQNQRSMLYIENLCELIREIIEHCDSGIFFPQNSEYVATYEIVREIAKAHNHRIYFISGFDTLFTTIGNNKGKAGQLVNKVFGNLSYVKEISQYRMNEYQKYSFRESVSCTEKKLW
ncbi:MAG: NAD-dependent epimerase/dehydratase family protein [Lachnospiraceae bacterium]